ncbi:MAG: Amuc_1100 family pilus-like protein [Akkermansia sp.]
MNISENKTVFALSAVFAIAFGGLMYLGYEGMTGASDANKRLDEIGIAFEDFNAAEFVPTPSNQKVIVSATKEVDKLNSELSAKLQAYKKATLNTKPITAVDFQNQVRKAIADLAQRAKEKGINLGSQAATLGMSVYQNQSAIKEEVAYRSYFLGAVEHANNALVEVGVPSIDKIFCAELPPEVAKGMKKAPDYFPLSFELSFTVKRGMLPQIINALLADQKYFYTITGFSALSETVPSEVSAYKAPAEVMNTAGEDGGDEAKQGADASRILAVQKLGDPNEKVQVHLNLQVLYFNPLSTNK